MALEKIDVLALGRGNLTDNSNAAVAFSSNNAVALWSSGITYAQYNVVEYSGRVYRSKVASNLANQPDTSPSQWETLYLGVKDGDVAFVINGGASTILQRAGGVWGDLGNAPATVALVDGQLSPADAVVFLGSDKSWALIQATIRRGSGQGRKRVSLYNVLNDNVSDVEYDHKFTDIGADINVTFTWTMAGGNVHMQYTSVSEGNAIEMKYTIKGWT